MVSLFLLLIVVPFVSCQSNETECIECPSLWYRFGSSCYLYVRVKLGFEAAENYCITRNATLVVFQNQKELDAVQEHMTIERLTWIGLSVRPTHFSEDPEWEFELPGLDTEALPWLLRTPGHGYKRFCLSNGRITNTNCVAYYKPEWIRGNYVNYYPCNYKHYFVCKHI